MAETRVLVGAPPWPVRWALGSPVAALAATTFFTEAWRVPWQGLSVAAVAVAAWLFGAMAQWPAARSRSERRWLAMALAAAAVLLVYWAGWRLPSGLVAAATPVACLAVFQGLLTLGHQRPALLRAAAVGGSAAAAAVVLTLPLERLAPGLGLMGGALRWVVLAALIAGTLTIWKEAGRMRGGEGILRVARSVLFGLGVWLPMAWWRSEGLSGEVRRPENLAFLALVLVVAWARPGVAGREDRRTRLSSMVVAGGLAVLAAGGWAWAASRGQTSPSAVYLGVAVGAAGLAALLAWRRGAADRPPAMAWWPETAYLLAALSVWRP